LSEELLVLIGYSFTLRDGEEEFGWKMALQGLSLVGHGIH